MAINYGQLEAELSDRLNAYFVANAVDNLFAAYPIPQNESEVKRDIEKGRVWVQYHTSDYIPSASISAVSHRETITIRLIFAVSNLRNADGFYNLINNVKTSLLGYQPQGCSLRLTISKYASVEYDNNAILNVLEMQTETVNVQIPEEPNYIGGQFTGLTTIDEPYTP